jgi:glycosyltransferase involved in cell wall biosynthesis
MTKSLPIVSTNIPGVRSLVTGCHNGLLADPDPVAIAAAINKILSDRDIYESSSRHNLHESAIYRWDLIAKELAAIYQSVQSQRAPKQRPSGQL